MKILAHRGHWREPAEKNTLAAFERAWSAGYGIETDLRDLGGSIVVSHDLPQIGAMDFETLLQAYAAQGKQTPLALNIKADGLQKAVAHQLEKYQVADYFVFDMSVPDSLAYLRSGMSTFLRLSEFEPWTVLHDNIAGIWLDAFTGRWWTLDDVRAITKQGRKAAIVSAELHGRQHEELWQALQQLEPETKAELLLCTDFPEDAERYFAA
ncbi:MAG: hypothetical protein P4L57_07685 [Rhizomicrobium sp.]|nr:hypothetical protein [Rhizomicrobium sp.]